ncbi:MAG: hypothetical protein ACJ8CR_22735, partial [Roseiflexaceae bacterium]
MVGQAAGDANRHGWRSAPADLIVAQHIMPHAPILIVLADDDKAIAALLYTIFEDEGYHVFACHSGEIAYKAI